MHGKRTKGSEYFTGIVQEGHCETGSFEVGDRVRVVPTDKKFKGCEGVIVAMIHGNFGKGRIVADVQSGDFVLKHQPLGRLRKLR